MKNLILCLVFLFCMISVSAQELKPIQLKSPDHNRGKSVMAALSDRHSTRTYKDQMLSDQDLSDLLWAANGINRPDGRRTAPSAMNKQDVDVYVLTKDGAYLYKAKDHSLQPVAKGDFRNDLASGQEFVKTAPVCLVLVTELARFGNNITEDIKAMAMVDVGIVCQNINIFCAATGLATVPRAYMDKEAIRKALKLSETQLVLINNPVGYPK